MSERQTVRDFVWSRLTADPSSLNLDVRISEYPEDLLVRLAGSGQRREIVLALRSLLTACTADDIDEDENAVLQFLRAALPLCDTLAATECKAVLKTILLLDDSEAWGRRLPEIQELAARALVGLPKDAADSRFWRDVACKMDAALPYALNAEIEIDLRQGLELLCETYMTSHDAGTLGAVAWDVVGGIAISRYGNDRVRSELLRACRAYPNPRNFFHHMVDHVFQSPQLKRAVARDISEVLSYESSGKDEARSELEGGRIEVLDFGGNYTTFLSQHATRVQRSPLTEAEGFHASSTSGHPTAPWLNYSPPGVLR